MTWQYSLALAAWLVRRYRRRTRRLQRLASQQAA
jgi:hypothetical protein